MKIFQYLLLVFILFPLLVNANTRGLQRTEEANRFEKEDLVAVIVGINQYSRMSGLSPLKYAVSDADAMAEFFESQGYLVRKLTNNEAQKNYILKAIRQAGELMTPGKGTLVFAFSGHGFGTGDNNYLAVAGADADNIEETGLALADVRRAIKATKARKRVLFVDACREDPRVGAKGGGLAFVDEDADGENILYSTQSGKLSYEDATLGHGAFTHYLLEGLRGKAAEEGWVTFTKLSQYVSKQVKQWVYRKHSAVQVPYRAGESTGVFVLAKSAGHRQLFEPEMTPIKGACFQMGRSGNEQSRFDDERLHQVCVADFEMGKTEVTVSQFRLFVDTTGYRTTAEMAGDEKNWRSPGFTQDDNHPVVQVSWKDAIAYAEWLKQETGKPYRLATEAEWEYAATAGNKTVYPWGNKLGSNKANCGDEHCGDTYPQTSPVGSFSAYGGLHDMSGNVYEWTCSDYDQRYSGGEKRCAVVDSGDNRAVRGGSWIDEGRHLDSSLRLRYEPDNRFAYIGFRLAIGSVPVN